MKKLSLLLILSLGVFAHAEDAALPFEDTWATWERRFDRAYEGITPHRMPGRAMGIIVPNETRHDLLPLPAFGYETLSKENFSTVIILMPCPNPSKADGLYMPDIERIETSVGDFPVDLVLAGSLADEAVGIKFDSSFFIPKTPELLNRQLIALKYVLKSSRATRLRVLPIFVQLSDPNGQTKDLAPLIADKIKDIEREGDIVIVITANLSRTRSEPQLVQSDGQLLNAIRELDSDAVLNVASSSATARVETPDASVIALGLLAIKWLGGEHGEILAYCHSSQLILTKDKNIYQGYAAAAFASAPRIQNKLSYFNREKMVDTFGELLRTDILTLTRQTVMSTLDPTAAKPPSLIDKQASRKWPVYVSLYNNEGGVAGQAGTHEPVGPLEESLRRFAVEATKNAQPEINRGNANNFVVDVSIPYGFIKVTQPEDLVPFLNGVIVYRNNKSSAMHPDGWRMYPDPHQLLGLICFRLGMKPWAYATTEAKIESFRVLSFNEKEPFQDLGASGRKKKKKSPDEEEEDLGGGGDGGLGGGLPF